MVYLCDKINGTVNSWVEKLKQLVIIECRHEWMWEHAWVKKQIEMMVYLKGWIDKNVRSDWRNECMCCVYMSVGMCGNSILIYLLIDVMNENDGMLEWQNEKKSGNDILDW